MRSGKTVLCVTALIMCLLSSCEDYNKDFPVVYFTRSYDLLKGSNQDLLTMCGSVIDTTAGYRGIVVFRQAYEGKPSDCIAFDLTCTHDSCKYQYTVDIEEFGILATCPHCGTIYDLMNYALPAGGNETAFRPLRDYRTFYDGRYVTVEN